MLLQKLRDRTHGNGHRKKTAHESPHYVGQVERLLDTAEKASSLPEITALLDRILDMAQQMTGAKASSLLMVDEEQQRLRFLVAEGEAGNQVQNLDLRLDAGICGWVVGHAKPVIINSVDEDDRFDHSVDDLTGFVTMSMIAVPLLRGGKVIGVLEVINKEEDGAFTGEDLGALEDFSSSRAFIMLVSMMATIVNNIRTHQLMIDWYKGMFETLIGAIDAKDPCAQGHSKRVKELSLKLGKALGLPPEELQVIELGALLHDIGKIDIHDVVLRKAGPLNDMEMYTMRKHALRGTNLLIGVPFFDKVRDIVLYHHERYDGTGYPNGLKGNAIPLRARIVAAAEAFDTMTTDRSYREKLSVEEALSELQKGSGTQFCPKVVKKFPEVVDHTPVLPLAEEPACEAPAADPEFAPPIPFGVSKRQVRLVVRALDETDALHKFRKSLGKVEEMKVLMDSYDEDEGAIFLVSVRAGLDLKEVLGRIPQVDAVEESEDGVRVTVKTPATQKVFQKGFNLDYRA